VIERFRSYKILRVVDSAPAGGILRRKPSISNQNHQRIARRYMAVDGGDEVASRLDIVYVHEYRIRTIQRRQPLMYPAGIARTLVAPVADENPRHP
jgi:hypothetical protein